MLYLIGVDESGSPEFRMGDYYILVGLAYSATSAHTLRDRVRSYILYLKRKYNWKGLEELKGKELYDRLKKRGKKEFVQVVDGILESLTQDLDIYSIVIIINKKDYSKEFNKIIDTIDNILENPPSNYLNVLTNIKIRKQIIAAMYGKPFGVLVRSQALNELFFRLNIELSERKSLGLLFIDSDASTLVSPAYDILGSTLVEGISARGKIQKPKQIINIILNDSKLEPGIQIADLIAYSIQRCYSDPDPIFIEPLKRVITKPEFYKIIPIPKQDPCKQGG